MAIPDARVMAHTNLFKSQMGGGAIALYQRMQRYQTGKGFGDFFRGLLRRILPIALNVGKSALSAISDAQEQGASFSVALKPSVRPVTKAAIHGALSQIDKAQQGRVDASGVGSTRRYIRVTKPSDRKRLSTTFRETHTHHPTHHHQTSTWRQWGRS